MVNFNQSSYDVAEDNGAVVIELVLSKQSSHSFEVVVSLMEITAAGTINFFAYSKCICIHTLNINWLCILCNVHTYNKFMSLVKSGASYTRTHNNA